MRRIGQERPERAGCGPPALGRGDLVEGGQAGMGADTIVIPPTTEGLERLGVVVRDEVAAEHRAMPALFPVQRATPDHPSDTQHAFERLPLALKDNGSSEQYDRWPRPRIAHQRERRHIRE